MVCHSAMIIVLVASPAGASAVYVVPSSAGSVSPVVSTGWQALVPDGDAAGVPDAGADGAGVVPPGVGVAAAGVAVAALVGACVGVPGEQATTSMTSAAIMLRPRRVRRLISFVPPLCEFRVVGS